MTRTRRLPAATMGSVSGGLILAAWLSSTLAG